MGQALTIKDAQTGFDKDDLSIRNRVLTFKAALDATPQDAPIKDELLMQFVREIADLTAQLTQVEKAFGPNDPMAQVLREALSSARSRRDTRRIELGLGMEKEEIVQKKPLPIQDTQQHDVKHDDGLAWVFLMYMAWRNKPMTPSEPGKKPHELAL